MRRSFVRTALMMVYLFGPVAAAQEPADRGNGRAPRFLLASSSQLVPVDVSRVPLLGRRLSLELDGATLKDALREISRRSGLRLVYGDDILPRDDRQVQLRAEAITVAAALTDVLFDAGVDVVFSPSGGAALVRRTATAAPAQVGAVSGHVTDSISREGIGGVTIAVEGTRLSTTTSAEGGYTIRGVPAGNRSITARRLGFVRQSQAVTVADNESTTLDFVLVRAPSVLSEVVTTATGDQRRVELGHVVGRINADSIVKAAPVSSLSELLNGRVPGLQVFTSQGTVGGEVHLRIRSPNTINLSGEPIVIVDGVRYTSVHTRAPGNRVNDIEPTSPLNDLNPNAIASIEVVKGPSAATLYGTDAANGVIVITTKRGGVGPTRWNGYAKSAITDIPDIRFAERYWGWHTERGAPSMAYSCLTEYQAAGYCTQDSVTVIPNPLNDPQRSIFEAKPRWEFGGNVSGGSQQLRYFLSGDFEQATGPLRMPPNLADSLAGVRGVPRLPVEQLTPNAFSKISLRSVVTVGLAESAEINAIAGYSVRTTRGIGGGMVNPYAASFMSGVTPKQPYGIFTPESEFSRVSTGQANRLFATVNGRWSPTRWLLTRATGGVDFTSNRRASLAPRDEVPSFSIVGAVGDDRGRQLATTAELAATASFNLGRFSSRTSIGTQYVRTLDDLLISYGTDLPPGGSSIAEATHLTASQTYREQVTLGSYVEQVLGVNQRLFLTGAMRADGASTFGQNYTVAVYPKAGVSWLVSEEPLLTRLPIIDELRLRYAFGASGQQPRPEWARPEYALPKKVYRGVVAPVYAVNGLGNRHLAPEQVREHEFGIDAGALANRVEVGLTWFRRKTVDQIVSISLPPGLGAMYTNVGLTTGRGGEVQVRARPLDRRSISWNLILQHSFYATTLVDLGSAVERRDPFGGWVEGYPIGARFMRPLLGYDDTNGDGVIMSDPSELQFGDTAVYVGESSPPRSQTLTSVVNLFDSRLRVSALLERHSGFTQLNILGGSLCSAELCRGGVDPNAPLADQAAAAAMRRGHSLIEPGDFTRLREVSVAIDLPARLARAARFSSATVSLHGRNLALWTSYRGADPESSLRTTSTGQPIMSAELGIPQSRNWALRLDVAF